jgi:RimJ/RimL family protein N-acetyltransferase
VTEAVSDIHHHRGAGPTLSATTPSGLVVVLRPPRLRDADSWRRARIADQAAIEPFWAYSELSWADRHRRRDWIRDYIAARRRMRQGRCVHTVVEVNGELAGQCDAWLEPYHLRGELGMWMGSRWAGEGVGATAVGLLIDYLFAEIGLERITAPIACGNVAPACLAKQLKFVHEGVLRSYMTVGKGRSDHDLWSQTREEWLARVARR